MDCRYHTVFLYFITLTSISKTVNNYSSEKQALILKIFNGKLALTLHKSKQISEKIIIYCLFYLILHIAYIMTPISIT